MMARYESPQNGHYREYLDSPHPRHSDVYFDRPSQEMAVYTPAHTPSRRHRDRDRDRDRDGDHRFRMTEREKESLKQRLTVTPAPSLHSRYGPPPRARSLSLTRSVELFSEDPEDSDSPVDEEVIQYRRPGQDRHRDRDGYREREREVISYSFGRDRDRDRDRQHGKQSQKRPHVRYHHGQHHPHAHSVSATPLGPWSRAPSPVAVPSVRDMRERFQITDRDSRDRDREKKGSREYRTEKQQVLHHSTLDPMRDLRFGLQRMNTDLDAMSVGMGRRIGRDRERSMPPLVRSASIDGGIGNSGHGVVTRRPGGAVRPLSPGFRRPIKPQYTQVHVLILTWSFHDLKQTSYTAPQPVDYVSLEEETRRVRETFESYGYKVREFLIPMQRSGDSLRSKINQFCRLAADDTLLVVYYHGHGCLDADNELVFSSHEHPSDPAWSQTAAAELYAAFLSGDSCPSHGRQNQYHSLVKKYERFRPVSEVRWEEIRPTLLNAPSDLLLILDCCAAGGANLGHGPGHPNFNFNWQAPFPHSHSRPGSPTFPHNLESINPITGQPYTKHLFAACAFESTTSDDMTAAMCEVLDEWTPDYRRLSSDFGGRSPFLTTKRLHQIMEEKLQRNSVGSQPIFKQLLPADPEQYITLPDLSSLGRDGRARRFGLERAATIGFPDYGDQRDYHRSASVGPGMPPTLYHDGVGDLHLPSGSGYPGRPGPYLTGNNGKPSNRDLAGRFQVGEPAGMAGDLIHRPMSGFEFGAGQGHDGRTKRREKYGPGPGPPGHHDGYFGGGGAFGEPRYETGYASDNMWHGYGSDRGEYRTVRKDREYRELGWR
ncbi:hypothetical protein QBC37DRAFT_125776 [Rhypophila decipiens]|uniref:Peptidase C14 caspase domain-containing protein n=1 Tax=Rhypophila decipiens TaxID=261697 RepID=A0AAN7B948_9PEZI|nr:hypothetical protein QBC37DRAFT_125776 [Rhypophila decipiens]